MNKTINVKKLIAIAETIIFSKFNEMNILKDLENIRLAIDVSGIIHRSKIHSNIKWWLQIINLMNKFNI